MPYEMRPTVVSIFYGVRATLGGGSERSCGETLQILRSANSECLAGTPKVKRELMTATTLTGTPRSAMRASKLRIFLRRISDVLDAYARSRVHRVVPGREMRRCQDEIRRYRRLMRPQP